MSTMASNIISHGAKSSITGSFSKKFLPSMSKIICHPVSPSPSTSAAGRLLHTTPPALKPRQKDLFTPSPFSRHDKINFGDKFIIHRELKEGDNAYGVRRYLLLHRLDKDDFYGDTEAMLHHQKQNAIASIHANKNILFGAKLHEHATMDNKEEYASQFLSACGPLLDVAKEDASINGQQPQALATLNGLCSWVKECLDKNGEGSQVLTNLMHGEQPNLLKDSTIEGEQTQSESITDNPPEEEQRQHKKKNPNSKIQKRDITIKTKDAKFLLEKESDRIFILEAVRAIATGIPRPGHSVVGAGTYRDGKDAWVSLAWEYCQLVDGFRDGGWMGGGGAQCRKGLEEVLLYKSREGEVSAIEHLAHTQPEYLRDAGGAMARLFFV